MKPIYSKWWISMTWTMAKPQPLSVCISVYIWQKAQFCPNLKTQSLLMNLLVFQINIRIKINIGLRQLKSWFLDVFGLSIKMFDRRFTIKLYLSEVLKLLGMCFCIRVWEESDSSSHLSFGATALVSFSNRCSGWVIVVLVSFGVCGAPCLLDTN